MKYSHRLIKDCFVFCYEERKLDTGNSGLLKGEFTSFIVSNSVKKLVIDLTSIEQCDSSGLSSLLVANRLIHEHRGQLRLVPSSKITHLFQITKLDRILPLCTTVDEAIAQLLPEIE